MVHAVLRRLAPQVTVIDLNHEVPAFDVAAGAGSLTRALPHLGPGVVLAVVDPGVGTNRRAVAVEAGEGEDARWFVGPDNGLMVPAIELCGGPRQVVELDRPASKLDASPATFDGRDLFAPAVAALCGGEDGTLGRPVPPGDLVRLEQPSIELVNLSDGRVRLRSVVTWVDRFGNAQLSAEPTLLPDLRRVGAVSVGHHTGQEEPPTATVVRLVRVFAELGPGESGVLVDANGRLALVVREGSAARHFGVGEGTAVELIW